MFVFLKILILQSIEITAITITTSTGTTTTSTVGENGKTTDREDDGDHTGIQMIFIYIMLGGREELHNAKIVDTNDYY